MRHVLVRRSARRLRRQFQRRWRLIRLLCARIGKAERPTTAIAAVLTRMKPFVALVAYDVRLHFGVK